MQDREGEKSTPLNILFSKNDLQLITNKKSTTDLYFIYFFGFYVPFLKPGRCMKRIFIGCCDVHMLYDSLGRIT